MYERHGKRNSSIYAVWCSMKARCLNPRSKAYEDYGARGITVSAEWMRFSQFYADMGDPPDGGTLERKDNSKGYSSDNCVWATRNTQGRNKRNNRLVTIDGQSMPLSAWAERFGIDYKVVHSRLRTGWPAEKALKTPLVRNRKGVPRGAPFHAFGTERGVQFTDPGASSPAQRGAPPPLAPSTHAAGPSSARSRDMERA